MFSKRLLSQGAIIAFDETERLLDRLAGAEDTVVDMQALLLLTLLHPSVLADARTCSFVVRSTYSVRSLSTRSSIAFKITSNMHSQRFFDHDILYESLSGVSGLRPCTRTKFPSVHEVPLRCLSDRC